MEKPNQTRSICFKFNSCMNDSELNEDIHQYPIARKPSVELEFLHPTNETPHFDNIYCINLNRRIDRWKLIEQRFKEKNIKVEKFDAIDGYFLKDENGLSKNEMGCICSHLEIIKDAKKNGYKKILIFEDDVYFSFDFKKRLQSLNNLEWKLLYLGASQYSWNNIDTSKYFYHSEKTLGTFAYAVDASIYDDMIQELSKKDAPADGMLVEIQKKYYGHCFTMYPNIVIADVRTSDIRGGRDMKFHAEKMKWDLNNFSIDDISINKKKILLVPDTPNWAFDNIAKAIVKYNPYPDKIKYDITYVKDIVEKKTDLKTSDWDLIFVMFEAEKSIPDGKNIIRGCYSAFWLEHPEFSPEKLGESFSNCKGAVFVNPELRRKISPFLPDKFPTSVIYDSSDENMFYPVEGIKSKEFTVVFVGNPVRKIKNFPDIQYICKQAGVTLEVCSNVPSKYLIYEYNKADVCINFSTFEGGPQTFAESSLCGTPMLIRSTNELSKLIPCFKGETREDFIDTLKFLKKNRDICRQRGKEARNFVLNNFTYKDTAKKFANFFLKLKNK